jgi:hypothetical protein
MERERSGDGKREIRLWTERPGDGERERERDPAMKRETQRWKERDPVMEREVSWSATGFCSPGGFGGRGWAEDLAERDFENFGEKKWEKWREVRAVYFRKVELIYLFIIFFFQRSATWARKSDCSGMRVSRIDELTLTFISASCLQNIWVEN